MARQPSGSDANVMEPFQQIIDWQSLERKQMAINGLRTIFLCFDQEGRNGLRSSCLSYEEAPHKVNDIHQPLYRSINQRFNGQVVFGREGTQPVVQHGACKLDNIIVSQRSLRRYTLVAL